MTLSAVLRRMDVAAVPHGFRSSFRDWAAEQTDCPREVAEMALAHSIGNKVEAAYRRGDLFEKRQQMMQDWADYASSACPALATDTTTYIDDAEYRSARCEKGESSNAVGAPSSTSLLLTSP